MKKICLFFLALFLLLVMVSIALTLLQNRISLREKIALIRIEGPIISSKGTIEEIKGYRDDASVKAVVLRVDSPGGFVVPSQEIYEEVKKTADKKHVVVSMGSLAASGGYYISAPASLIVANPGTTTGSIGVIMEIPNLKGLMDKIGIKREVIKTGKYKDLASVFRGIGKEEKKILQSVLDDVHNQFIQSVADGRNIPIEKVREIADGRIFTGRQAIEIGLVDKIGNLQDAIKEASTLAGIKGEPHVITKKDEFSIFDLLKNRFPDKLEKLFPSIRMKFLMTP